MARNRFDRRYYQRFYEDPETRVTSPAARRRLGRFVAAYLAHLELPVRSVLDVGCGTGEWQSVVRREFRRAEYTGVEISTDMCEEHGWEHGSIIDWDHQGSFDLVICQGVLQYLRDRDAAKAVDNLIRWTGSALYLEALTRRDWKDNCDTDVTDDDVNLRTGDWYRGRLRDAFTDCGGGLFVKRDTDVVFFELEAHD